MPSILKLLLALLLLGAGLPASASLDPAALQSAIELFNRRQPAEARQAFEALARSDANNAEVCFYLGRLALQQDNHEQAVTQLEKAVALSPDDSRYHHRLGDAYGRSAQQASLFARMGLAKKCRAAYQRAVALDPRNVDARLSLLGFYQQAPALVGGGLDQAHREAEAIKQLDANRGRQAIAGLYVAEKKYAEAFREYESVLAETPDDYAALFQVGRLAAVTGERLERGLAALRRCLEQTPPANQPGHAAAHWRIGNIFEQQSDVVAARAAYEAALHVDPKFPQAIESLKKL